MEGAFRSGTILVGKYRIDNLLGRDGMALVFAATHLQVAQPVVLKILAPETVTSLAVHARFLREAQSIARLSGQHVARIIDVGILPEGAPYSVMEALHGIDLASEVARRGALMTGEAVDYVLQACEALAEAHAHGIVHGDIKAANVFIAARPDGTPLIKVLGFEISRTSDGVSHPGTLAPEQRRPHEELDGRTDVWALGIVMYECVTGRHPFQADPDSPRPMDPGIPRALQAVVLRCLEKARDARFPSIADLAAALAPFAHDQRAAAAIVDRASFMSQGPAGGFELGQQGQVPIIAPPTVGPGMSPSRSRRRYATLALAALAVSLSGIAAAALIAPGRSQSSNDTRAAPTLPGNPIANPSTATSGPARPSIASPRATDSPADGATVTPTPPSAEPAAASAAPPSSPPVEPARSAPPSSPPIESAGAGSSPPGPPPAEPTAATSTPPPSPPLVERTAARSVARPKQPPAERAVTTPTPPSSTRKRNESCEAVDVDDLMTRAAVQYNAGAAASALSFTRVALGCKQTDRMYWLAVMYACAAHDLATAKLYFPKVATNVQSGLEIKCQRENLDVRSR